MADKGAKENIQLQNQVLYAPFVKAADKVRKDVADLSLSDFQPKRFALNYDPPMISKWSPILADVIQLPSFSRFASNAHCVF